MLLQLKYYQSCKFPCCCNSNLINPASFHAAATQILSILKVSMLQLKSYQSCKFQKVSMLQLKSLSVLQISMLQLKSYPWFNFPCCNLFSLTDPAFLVSMLQLKSYLAQAFKWALLFLFFLLFPTFLICSYFSLLFHENALLSLLFHSKLSFTRKNPDIFPRSLPSLGFYALTSMFIQGACRFNTSNFNI